LFLFEIGVDLGSSRFRMYIPHKGVVINERSLIALNELSGDIMSEGDSVENIIGKTPPGIELVYPIKRGVINDLDMAVHMIKKYITGRTGSSVLRPKIAMTVPIVLTEVERNSLLKVALTCGARTVKTIPSPVAAAFGCGIDISLPNGRMVIDIGASVTDIAVMSLNSVVCGATVKIGGDDFTSSLIEGFEKHHGIRIGYLTAEDIKMNHTNFSKEFSVGGMSTGIKKFPHKVTSNAGEIREMMLDTVQHLGEGINNVLEKTPPELISDIINNSIVICGGGAKLSGLDRFLKTRLNANIKIAEEPEFCAVKGAVNVFKNMDCESGSMTGVSRDRSES